jgi:hypothetical protein
MKNNRKMRINPDVKNNIPDRSTIDQAACKNLINSAFDL